MHYSQTIYRAESGSVEKSTGLFLFCFFDLTVSFGPFVFKWNVFACFSTYVWKRAYWKNRSEKKFLDLWAGFLQSVAQMSKSSQSSRIFFFVSLDCWGGLKQWKFFNFWVKCFRPIFYFYMSITEVRCFILAPVED